MFPSKLSNLDHLREYEMIKFKEETLLGKKFTIVSYMIASPGLWKVPQALECRGITYNEAGECCSVGFEKFFNVGENEENQEHNLLNNAFAVVMDKRDGSMITPILINDEVFFKTKKSFYSDVAKNANKNSTIEVEALSHYLLKRGLCPIFEYTDRDNKIVIDYGEKPTWTLLAVRDMTTGGYCSPHLVGKLCEEYGVNGIEVVSLKFTDILATGREKTGVEGWVLWFIRDQGSKPDLRVGKRVKLKTQWYLNLHRVNTELRERDVVEMILDETIDDIKSAVTAAGHKLDPIEGLEMQVAQVISDLKHGVDLYVKEWGHLDRKEFAVKFKHEQFFALLMRAYIGQEPNYIEYFRKHYLPDYSLRTMYSDFKVE
jgi:T4 RnlA family RNA ligase